MSTLTKKKINNKTVRFSDAPWYSPGLEVVIGGAGGISSWLSMFLGRQESYIHIFDFDTIDETNLGGQLYQHSDVGTSKVYAIENIVGQFTTGTLYTYEEPYTKDSLVLPVMFSGFDNMAARKLMFENWCKQEDRVVFIDGRLTSESGQIYTVTKGREDLYRSTLFDDKEVDEQPCSFKATSHCGAMIASYMTASLNNVIANQKDGTDDRDTPFKITFSLPIFLFETNDK